MTAADTPIPTPTFAPVLDKDDVVACADCSGAIVPEVEPAIFGIPVMILGFKPVGLAVGEAPEFELAPAELDVAGALPKTNPFIWLPYTPR